MAEFNLDSSDDSVLDKSPRRSDKSSTVGTLSKQKRNNGKHNQQQSPNTVQPPSGFRDEASSPTDCQIVGSEQTTEPTDVVDVSKRVVKDSGGKLGMYTGACRMTTSISTGRPVYIPTGQGRMDYGNNSVYAGEWKDGLWHGDGTFTPTSDGQTYTGEWMKGKRDGLGLQSDSEGNQYVGDWKDDVWSGDGDFTHHSGWTVEGRWEKDRCIECSSISGLTDANYESACDWAQQQESSVVIPPLLDAIGGMGVDISRFLRDARSKGWTSAVRFVEDEFSLTVLHAAIKEDNMNEVKRLLKDGAAVEKEDKDGFTALDIAVLNKKWGIVRKLGKK